MLNKKIVFLMPSSSQDSEFENQPHPEFSWETPQGEMVGIWGLEWGDLHMKALAEYYPQYDCEVWQPDLRADKIYTAQLLKNLVHRNFPACLRSRLKYFRVVKELWSRSYRDSLRELDHENTVFIIPLKHYKLWLKPLIFSLRHSGLLYRTFLNLRHALPDTNYSPHPVKALAQVHSNLVKQKWMKRVRNLLVQNDNPAALAELQTNYPQIRMFPFRVGLDLDFWQLVMSKEEARRQLEIASDLFVIIMSQRLVPEYQIDKFIEVVSRLRPGRDFVCYITGHGTKEYEEYLNGLVAKYCLQNKVRFVGFVTDEELRGYFIAADLFATVPYMFAGSGGAQKCIALGTPILHVTLGGTYSFLKEHDAGIYVGPHDYDDWVVKLEQLIGGSEVRIIPREIVESKLSWKQTADDLHNAIQNLAR